MVLSRLSLLISEDEFTSNVIELAHFYKWLVFHPRPCRTEKGWRTLMQGDPGFPDLVMVRDGMVVMAELKKQNGKVSAAQRRWHEAIGNAYVWRPSDIDEIRKVLR